MRLPVQRCVELRPRSAFHLALPTALCDLLAARSYTSSTPLFVVSSPGRATPVASSDPNSPFSRLRFYRTWHSSGPPSSIALAIEAAAKIDLWVKGAPALEKKKLGIKRRGASPFWQRAATNRLAREKEFQSLEEGAEQGNDERNGVIERMQRTESWEGAFGDVPRTETELLRLVRRLCRLDAVKTPSVVAFHSHPTFRQLVSANTYIPILCCAEHDLKLTQEVIAEMEERQIDWSSDAARTLLKTQLKRGDASAVAEISEFMSTRGWRHEVVINWRRNLGEDGIGNGDKEKIWRSSKGLEARFARNNEQREEDTREKARYSLPDTLVDANKILKKSDSRLARQPTDVPSDYRQHSSSDITKLVESLVQDFRGSEALKVAQSWLDAQRTRSPTSSSDPLPLPPVPYAQSAIVLLNILIKALFVKDVPHSDIRDFITFFIKRHGTSLPTRIRPNAVTLKELLESNSQTYPKQRFSTACELVNWFGRTFGLPARLPFLDDAPRRFREKWTSPSPDEEEELVGVAQPVCHTSCEVATQVLDAAIASHRLFPNEKRTRLFRKWWKNLDKSGSGWGSHKLKTVVDSAVDRGLLLEGHRWV